MIASNKPIRHVKTFKLKFIYNNLFLLIYKYGHSSVYFLKIKYKPFKKPIDI